MAVVATTADGRPRRALGMILLVSALLRWWLICGGGQGFWPDESRYSESRIAVTRMAAGQWRLAWSALFGAADHLLFKIVGLLPAAIEQWLGPSQRFPAAFFASFSVLSIWMVARIARRVGGDDATALFAALLAAGSNCLFYYSRHFFPYDLALFFGLCAWDCALAKESGSLSYRSGLWAALCFLSYNGYWLLGGAALVAHVLLVWRVGLGPMLTRAARAMVGLLVPLGLIAGMGAALGQNVPRELAALSGTISNSEIGQGWRIIWEFPWAAEKLNALLLALGLGAAALGWLRGRAAPAASFGLAAAAGILGALYILSDWVRRFIILGRLERMAIPFACICGGAVLAQAWRSGPFWRRLGAAGLALYLLQASLNFSGPLRQWFPIEFRAAAAAKVAHLPRPVLENYRVVNASFFFAPEVISTVPLPAETIWQVPHPQQFVPYLFEGITREQRELFLARDGAMRLVKLGAEENHGWLGADPALRRLDGYPGRVAMRVRFRSDAYGRHEPLVVTGESGKGDFIYVVYQDATEVYLGFDHWGIGGVVSRVFPVDFSKAHELVIGMGSMYPPAFPGPERRRLYLAIDGRVIFDREQDFHPSDPGAVIFGLNLLGGSTTHARFSGVIEQVTPVSP